MLVEKRVTRSETQFRPAPLDLSVFFEESAREKRFAVVRFVIFNLYRSRQTREKHSQPSRDATLSALDPLSCIDLDIYIYIYISDNDSIIRTTMISHCYIMSGDWIRTRGRGRGDGSGI